VPQPTEKVKMTSSGNVELPINERDWIFVEYRMKTATKKAGYY
jgi:hypothetical protein